MCSGGRGTLTLMNPNASNERPLIGILGGMGPEATADFYAKLIKATPAATDQEHLKVMIWADPSVPDRSKAIAGNGEDPVPSLVNGVQKLAEAGAAFYVVACNSAHAFLPEVRQQVDLDYLSIIEETADHISSLTHVKHVGLLATDATLDSRLYQDALRGAGVETLTPSSEDQQTVMASIYAVKGGALSEEDRSSLVGVVNRMVDRGADAIIAGCTEIPLALWGEASARPLIDPATLLANRVVAEAVARTTSRHAAGDHPSM